MSTDEAYRRCAAITRSTAANFYYGIRLLAPDRRRAMCAVYAFARHVDDIGDGPLAREQKLRLLDEQSRALATLSGSDPVMVALADAHARFQLPPDALAALIEGVRMDVLGVTYDSFDDLVLYCRRVAGAIGRACLAIFALRDPSGAERALADQLADDLGVALQLTNILRDIREDALNGRVYLPAEDLRRFGLIAPGQEHQAPRAIARLLCRSEIGQQGVGEDTEPGSRGEGGVADARRLDGLVRFQAERARRWFDRGLTLAPLLDRRSAACVLAMAGIYSRLLTRISADPERALRERIALPMREKTWVAARSMLGGCG
jgi:15-cis-phytoene synthase